MEEKIAYVDFENKEIIVNGNVIFRTNHYISLIDQFASLADAGYTIKKSEDE